MSISGVILSKSIITKACYLVEYVARWDGMKDPAKCSPIPFSSEHGFGMRLKYASDLYP